jgi:hypothetical protein
MEGNESKRRRYIEGNKLNPLLFYEYSIFASRSQGLVLRAKCAIAVRLL